MRVPIKLTALLAMLLLGFTLVGGTGAVAQDDAASELQPGDLEGLQNGVGRYYSIDYSAMMENMSTPGAEMEMPSGVFLLGATILEFDNDDNARAALAKLDEETDSEDMGMSGEDAEVSEIDLDLGDDNISYSSSEDVDGQPAETVISLVQQGNFVYFVVVAGSDADIQALTVDFTNHLIETDGSGQGEFNEDGTSTGGLWDKFPAADDEMVSSLIAYDQIVFPVEDATPES